LEKVHKKFMVVLEKIFMNNFFLSEEITSAFPKLLGNCSWVLGQCTHYCAGCAARTLADYIKLNCLSDNTKRLVGHADSYQEIFHTLDGIFCRPKELIESILKPVGMVSQIHPDDGIKLFVYYTDCLVTCFMKFVV
jgi:hypothetical protein